MTVCTFERKQKIAAVSIALFWFYENVWIEWMFTSMHTTGDGMVLFLSILT